MDRGNNLTLEVNITYFPEDKPKNCEKESVQVKWEDIKTKVYHQEAQIHLIKLGNTSTEFQSQIFPRMSLGKCQFEIFPENEIIWKSSQDLSDWQPIGYLYHLLDCLKDFGYTSDEFRDREQHFSQGGNLVKLIYILKKKANQLEEMDEMSGQNDKMINSSQPFDVNELIDTLKDVLASPTKKPEDI